jgi:hypothetical protein
VPGAEGHPDHFHRAGGSLETAPDPCHFSEGEEGEHCCLCSCENCQLCVWRSEAREAEESSHSNHHHHPHMRARRNHSHLGHAQEQRSGRRGKASSAAVFPRRRLSDTGEICYSYSSLANMMRAIVTHVIVLYCAWCDFLRLCADNASLHRSRLLQDCLWAMVPLQLPSGEELERAGGRLEDRSSLLQPSSWLYNLTGNYSAATQTHTNLSFSISSACCCCCCCCCCC